MALARATTETEAANAALRILGVGAIADINAANSTAARECRAAFGGARDEALRRKNWNFAAAWATPAMASVKSLGPLKNIFLIPDDCVRVRAVLVGGAELGPGEWAPASEKIGTPPADANVLVTNAATITVSYTRRITNVALWDPEFVTGFAERLAAKVAPSLSKEFTLGTELEAVADQTFGQAAHSDAQEAPPQAVSRETSWITARR
jgi:hypothetical protein